LNGRWFAGRRITCEYFDGVTNFKRAEDSDNEEAEEKRLEEFGKWIENSS
jgi:HIV Tat-specific factor 1